VSFRVAATATFSRRTGSGEVFRARGAAGVDQRQRVKEDEAAFAARLVRDTF